MTKPKIEIIPNKYGWEIYVNSRYYHYDKSHEHTTTGLATLLKDLGFEIELNLKKIYDSKRN